MPRKPKSPPANIRELLERLGLSQRAAATELDIDERTMRRYCAGDTPVPRVVMFALRWLQSGVDATASGREAGQADAYDAAEGPRREDYDAEQGA